MKQKKNEGTSYNINCIDCGETIDALQLIPQGIICKERVAQLGQNNPEGFRLLAELKDQEMNASDQEAISDERRRNYIHVKRANVVDDAIEASKNDDFLSKLSLPLVVRFTDKAGVDCGALRIANCYGP